MDQEGRDYNEQWSSMMVVAWVVLKEINDARFGFDFQQRGTGFDDRLDMRVYGKGL